MKKNIKNILFVVIILILIILKQSLVNNLPIMAYAFAKEDDELMVTMAKNILEGKWLGEYNELILTKGVMFPLFLAFSNIIGMTYISFQTLFYSISCLIFIYGIKDFVKSKKLLLLIFIALIFNPVSFATNTLLRVYRNGLTLSQVLIIFGSYIGLYMNRNNKKKSLIYSILAGFGFAFLYHTREDAFWIIPFIATVTIILIGLLIKENKKEVLKNCKLLIFIYILPILFNIVVTNAISFTNYKYYGTYTYNELNKSEFTKCMKVLYSIKPNIERYRASFPDEKIDRMCEKSETLNSIKQQLLEKIDSYIRPDINGDDVYIEDGLFFWALRESAAKCGYYENSQKSNEFYRKITSELKTAIKNGDFETQFTMPSSLMPPWRKGNLPKLFNAFGKEIIFVSNFDDVDVNVEESVVIGLNNIFEDFKNITNNKAIDPTRQIHISGWYANLKENDITLEIQNENGEILDNNLDLFYREDVKKYLETEKSVESDGITGFNILIETNTPKIFLVAKKGENILSKDEIKEKNNISNEDYILRLDTVFDLQAKIEEKAKPQVNNLKNIIKFYQKLSFIVFIISFVMYVIMFVKMIIEIIKKNYNSVNTILILSGIILSLIVLMLGVAYNEISSVDSISYLYLSGTYPLFIAFCFISIFKFVEMCFEKIKCLNKN